MFYNNMFPYIYIFITCKDVLHFYIYHVMTCYMYVCQIVKSNTRCMEYIWKSQLTPSYAVADTQELSLLSEGYDH